MCKLNNPDCLNCPYPECTATEADIRRQWRSYKQRVLDNPDSVQKTVGSHVTPILIGTSYTKDVKKRQAKYNKTEKGKARLKRYYESEKGRANEKRKRKKIIESGKNAEYCRRYYQKHKSEALQIV